MATLTNEKMLALDSQLKRALAGQLDDQALVDLVNNHAEGIDLISPDEEVERLHALATEAATRLKAAEAETIEETAEAEDEAHAEVAADPYKEFRERVAQEFADRDYEEAAQALREFVPDVTPEKAAEIAAVLKRNIESSGIYGNYRNLAWKVHYLARQKAGLLDEDVEKVIAYFEEKGGSDAVFAEEMRMLPKAVTAKDKEALEVFLASVDETLKDRREPDVFRAVIKSASLAALALLEIYVGFISDADQALEEEQTHEAFTALTNARKIEFAKCGLRAINWLVENDELPDCVYVWLGPEDHKVLASEEVKGKRAFALFNIFSKPLWDEVNARRPAREPYRPNVMRPGKTARERAKNPHAEADRRRRQLERSTKFLKDKKSSNKK